jgi:hypothetical protein
VGEEEEERGDRVWRSNGLTILHETQTLKDVKASHLPEDI